jgi:hypothetical protein
MLFSQTRPHRFLTSLAAAAGVGSMAFPLVAPWHLIFLFAAALANLFTARSLLLGGLASSVFVASVLAGLLPSPLAAGVLAATSIAGSSPLLGAAVLLLQTSIFSTAIQIAGQPLYLLGIEAALTISAIQSSREKLNRERAETEGRTLLKEDFQEPVARHACVLRQFKRPKEISLLRQVYGKLFFKFRPTAHPQNANCC